MHAVLAALSAVVVFAAVAMPLGLAEVWDQSVVYRTDAASRRDIPATVAKVASTLWDRDLALLLFAAVAIGCAVVARRRGRGATSGETRVSPRTRAGGHERAGPPMALRGCHRTGCCWCPGC
ncbi:MAG: hypothetical protein M5U19_05010 [Microthrixaceae bacterium]|nr:hypothetical protein [Microthrixaceae bacterium]